jgi:hypothetical protein
MVDAAHIDILYEGPSGFAILWAGFVVRACRPHDSIATDNVRPGRPHHKSGGIARELQMGEQL